MRLPSALCWLTQMDAPAAPSRRTAQAALLGGLTARRRACAPCGPCTQHSIPETAGAHECSLAHSQTLVCKRACEMLMKEPLEPAVTMRTTLLVSRSDACASLPASSRALFSTCGRARGAARLSRAAVLGEHFARGRVRAPGCAWAAHHTRRKALPVGGGLAASPQASLRTTA